jgi:hypothetical protein
VRDLRQAVSQEAVTGVPRSPPHKELQSEVRSVRQGFLHDGRVQESLRGAPQGSQIRLQSLRQVVFGQALLQTPPSHARERLREAGVQVCGVRQGVHDERGVERAQEDAPEYNVHVRHLRQVSDVEDESESSHDASQR